MGYRTNPRRRALELRRWRPRPWESDPQWLKKLADSREKMHHFDRLPAPLRTALAKANAEFKAEQMAAMWDALPMSELDKIAYLLAAIQANDRPSTV